MGSWSTKSSAKSWDKAEILGPEFYARDTVQVARELLGKVFVVRSDPRFPLESARARVTVGRIVETEAYHGTDPASHSARGMTPRSRIMFGPAGVAYVYFIYGNYEMLNFVTEREGYPGAVLIRAVEPLAGEPLMKRRRKGLTPSLWTSGPGRLCRAMGIKMAHNGANLSGPELYVIDDGERPRRPMASERVGISLAKEQPWRFFDAESVYVSRVAQNKPAARIGAA